MTNLDIALVVIGAVIAIAGNRYLASIKKKYIDIEQAYAALDAESDEINTEEVVVDSEIDKVKTEEIVLGSEIEKIETEEALVDYELHKCKSEEELADAAIDKINNQVNACVSLENEYLALQKNYQSTKLSIEQYQSKIKASNISVGTVDNVVYERRHKPQDLPILEEKLEQAICTSKSMIKNKTAAICGLGDFTVNDRKAAAKTMVNREIKLRLRCFDNEVSSAMTLADWNNINRLNERVNLAFEEINQRGRMMKIELSEKYLKARLDELNLSYEVSQLKNDIREEEREEQRIQRETEREESRLKASSEKAIADRERMQKLVEQELTKLDYLNEEQRALLAEHQEELDILKQKEVRATSMAQITRAGFVYVISNPMSFGEGVIKIGMTRRLDPNERVHELGDASVPDTFDVHAYFFCEDAPALEKYLHKTFSEKQVNLVNSRREFFFLKPEIAIEEALKAPFDSQRTQ
ncbi:DUF4041 domain-containing protein [Marinomonas sp. 15G1-11]|uniref:DUF4041 domain-containing protein n=1 Tax=Marinomonas phaeophyticola TaxID=3004091 RepID=A0ABT4JYY4_9GAMM|nr:DUF4041 domain-containing protein [Marinomonas sp. 15G1-11]MCZ2722973.1 DUF4041 domain-containing protein [Marinomonas sp. 15G1-11]